MRVFSHLLESGVYGNGLRGRSRSTPHSELGAIVKEAFDAGMPLEKILYPENIKAARGAQGGVFIELSLQVRGAGVGRGIMHELSDRWYVSTSGGAWRTAEVGPYADRTFAEKALMSATKSLRDEAEKQKKLSDIRQKESDDRHAAWEKQQEDERLARRANVLRLITPIEQEILAAWDLVSHKFSGSPEISPLEDGKKVIHFPDGFIVSLYLRHGQPIESWGGKVPYNWDRPNWRS